MSEPMDLLANYFEKNCPAGGLFSREVKGSDFMKAQECGVHQWQPLM